MGSRGQSVSQSVSQSVASSSSFRFVLLVDRPTDRPPSHPTPLGRTCSRSSPAAEVAIRPDNQSISQRQFCFLSGGVMRPTFGKCASPTSCVRARVCAPSPAKTARMSVLRWPLGRLKVFRRFHDGKIRPAASAFSALIGKLAGFHLIVSQKKKRAREELIHHFHFDGVEKAAEKYRSNIIIPEAAAAAAAAAVAHNQTPNSM